MSSALRLVSGLLDGKKVANIITQTSHGFSAGFVVRYDIDTAGFTAAQANSPEGSEVAGIVESVSDVNTFTLVYAGEVNMTDFVTGTSNTDEEVYFLSSETAGHLSAFAPTTSGHVIKPILTRRGTDAGTSIQRAIVTNYIGTVIGGEATVSLQGLVPVGVIQSWAGTSSGVPEGWGMCDGGTVDAFVYAEYFQAVGTRYGVHQRFNVPSLSAEPNSIQGLEVNQFNPANDHEIKGTVISWDNSTKLLTVENETSVLSDVAGLLAFTPVDEVPGRDALFVSSIAGDFTSNLRFTDGSFNSSNPNGFIIENPVVSSVKKPDMRGRVPVGSASFDNATDFFRGQFGGEIVHQLTLQELPSHDHQFSSGAGNIDVNITGSGTFETGEPSSSLSHSHYMFDIIGPGLGLMEGPERGIGSVASNDNNDKQNARGEGFIDYDGTSIAPDNSTHGLVGVPVDRAGNNVDLAHGHIIDASRIADQLGASFDSSDLALDLQPQGGNIPHNTMQPYLTTNYIVRLTSQQSASILEGVSLNFNLDEIKNTTDPVATENQIIRFDGTNFKVVHSNISGYYKTSNKNLILNTSEGTDGATTERIYISQSKKGVTPTSGGGEMAFYAGKTADANMRHGPTAMHILDSGVVDFKSGISGDLTRVLTMGEGLTTDSVGNTYGGSNARTVSAAYELSTSAPTTSSKGVVGTVWYQYGSI